MDHSTPLPNLTKRCRSRRLYVLLLVFCWHFFPYCAVATAAEKAPSMGEAQGAALPQAQEKSAPKEIQDLIQDIEDEDLRDFVHELHRTGRNPYPDLPLDIWLLKAIEEEQHALAIVKFLVAKGMVSKSLPWFSKIDAQLKKELPMHHAARLGRADIVKFLLEQGVRRYDRNDLFIAAMKSMHPTMVRLLLRKKIFDEEQLYGSTPSILPEFLWALCFGCVIPAVLWVLSKYGYSSLRRYLSSYYGFISLGISVLILLHLFMNIPTEKAEGIGYLHILATLPLHDDPDGVKAQNISKIAKLLLREGADPNQKGTYIQELGVQDIKQIEGFTALHGAIKRHNLPLVKVLIQYGANVNAMAVLKSFDGETTMSGMEGNELVIYLPFWGSLESKILEVSTPLDYAAKAESTAIYNYLKSLTEPHKAKHYKDLYNFLA